jgi:hypothetical protein
MTWTKTFGGGGLTFYEGKKKELKGRNRETPL